MKSKEEVKQDMEDYFKLTEKEIADLLDEEFSTDEQTLQCHSETINGLIVSLIVGNGLKWFENKGSTAMLILALLYGKSALEANPKIYTQLKTNAKVLNDFCKRHFGH